LEYSGTPFFCPLASPSPLSENSSSPDDAQPFRHRKNLFAPTGNPLAANGEKPFRRRKKQQSISQKALNRAFGGEIVQKIIKKVSVFFKKTSYLCTRKP